MRRRLTDDKYKILNIVNTIFFFFSSRRRHTRFDCDWSSDVCSSDLRGLLQRQGARGRRPPLHRRAPSAEGLLGHARSEEHTSELQSQSNLVCRLLLEKKKKPFSTVRNGKQAAQVNTPDGTGQSTCCS